MDLKKKHGRITGEMRELAIRTMREGDISKRQLAEELGVSDKTLIRWSKESELEHNNEPLTKAERIELEELRKKTARLEQEVDILKKFRAFVANRKRASTRSSKRRRRKSR
jgi:transposase-like protein